MLCPSLGLLAGNKDQLAIVHFAPAADVFLAQLNEEHRAVKVSVPIDRGDFLLARIDPYK